MNKLLAGRTRFFNHVGALACVSMVFGLSALAPPSLAEGLAAPVPMELDAALKDLLQGHQNKLDGSKPKVDIGTDFSADWIDKATKGAERLTDQQKEFATAIGREALGKALGDLKADSQVASAPVFDLLIFVSYSIPENELMALLAWAAQEKNALVVMRGVPDGMNIPQGILAMQRLAATMDPMPNITLDPTAFDRYGVTVVPTLVALSESQAKERALVPIKEIPTNEDEAKGLLKQATEEEKQKRAKADGVPAKYLARVEGISDPSWLQRRIAAGATGDFGRPGPVLEIEEPDLIEVMKSRVAAVDWAQKRESALDRFWSMRTYIELPRAYLPRTRRIDASVVATGDIRTSKGDFVARRGDRVNPLATRPFTQAIIVFDARDKKQVDLIVQKLPEIKARESVRNVVFISTGLDRDEGWDGYKDITTRLDAPVFLLTSDIQSRFVLEKSPSVITANSTHFIVEELPVILEPEEAQQARMQEDGK